MGGKNNEKRGGARHFAKLYVEPSLLIKAERNYTQLEMDLGSYESVSKSGAIHAEGLLHRRHLLEDLLKLSLQVRFQVVASEQVSWGLLTQRHQV